MPGADKTNTPPRPEMPELETIEAEGQAAVEKLARAFVAETLRNGGRIDLARLERAGPSVQAAYRRLLAQVAARTLVPPKLVPAPAPADAEAGETRDGNGTAKPAAPPSAGTGSKAGGQTALPRAEKGWRDQRHPAPSFKVAARRRGRLAGAIVTAVALAAVAWLHL